MEQTTLTHNKISIEFDGDLIKVTNLSDKNYRVQFMDPSTEYIGYMLNNFSPGTWVGSNPNEWDESNSITPDIILIGEDHYFVFKVNTEDRTFYVDNRQLTLVNNFNPITDYVSIIIPAYQSEQYINKTIESLLNLQEQYLKIEIIVGIDGCENTLKLMSQTDYPNNVKIYFFEENQGLSYVKNTLTTKSTHNNLIIFDSDDIPMPNLIRRAVEHLRTNDIVYWRNIKYYENTGELEEFDERYNLDNTVVGGCFAIKRKMFFELNGFFPWRCHSDAEFKERLKYHNYKMHMVNEPLFIYNIRENSLSRNPSTREGSKLRNVYKSILSDKIGNRNLNNPDRLYLADCIKIR